MRQTFSRSITLLTYYHKPELTSEAMRAIMFITKSFTALPC